MRDATNDLYDTACELLEASRALRSAASRPDCDAALAPVLGCLQAALNELARTQVKLRNQVIQASSSESAECAATLSDLAHALLAAQRCAEDARRAASRHVAGAF